MQLSLSISTVVHAGLLGWALVSFSAPKTLEVADVEAVPVSIVPIDLPETEAKALNSDTQPITVSVNSEGGIFLQETEIALNEVVPKLEAISTTGFSERIYVRGDANADYGTVMKVMARISAAGYKNLGLVTQQEQDG